MREIPKPFEVYEHFKGNRYQILCIAKNAEDLREQVVYQGLYGDYPIFVRDLDEFMSDVDEKKYPAHAGKARFTKQKSESVEQVAPDRSVHASTQVTVTESQPAQAPAAGSKAEEKNVADDPKKQAIKETVPENVLLRFLDAESDEDKLELLTKERDAFTLDMTEAMAVTMDIEYKAEDLEGRLKEIRDYLMLKARYETSRLR